MRSYIPAYEMKTPRTLDEALGILGNEPGVWQPFAGGTDLMVILESGRLAHRQYMNIWNLDELRGIDVTTHEVSLGALTTYSEVQSHPVLREEFSMLCQAASETGGLAIQNRGTIGGNIVNGSPAADSPPALLAYDADIELTSAKGSRRVAYHEFHRDYKKMDLREDELLTRIHLPRNTSKLEQYYRKVGTRKAQAISKVCMAAIGRLDREQLAEVRIALGSVAPIPLRCLKTEAFLTGSTLEQKTISGAKEELAREISPIDDVRSTKNYRLRVSLNLLEQFLNRFTIPSP
jgi:CO/xanthine dehydrogenase FAD-binding subunit